MGRVAPISTLDPAWQVESSSEESESESELEAQLWTSKVVEEEPDAGCVLPPPATMPSRIVFPPAARASDTNSPSGIAELSMRNTRVRMPMPGHACLWAWL